MGKVSETYWNTAYTDVSFRSDHDGWLKRYEVWLDPTKGRVLDLGSGLGHNARVLHAQGFDVLACDLSEKALERIREEQPEIETLQWDMANELPFADHSMQVIIADLSLHYFPENTTKQIVQGLHRVLKPEGVLLFRVNAISELAVKPGSVPVENDPHLYTSEGILRRFFDAQEIHRFFSDQAWRTLACTERVAGRYGQAKALWEVALCKEEESCVNFGNERKSGLN